MADDDRLEGDCVVILDDQGRVELLSSLCARWLDEPMRQRLVEMVQEIEGRGLEELEGQHFRLHRFEVWLTRMMGKGGQSQRYLAKLRPLRTLRLRGGEVLTPAQRQVVRYAACGATVDEIARSLDKSAHTVKTQLKHAYQRLGVSSRVELAERLEERPSIDVADEEW